MRRPRAISRALRARAVLARSAPKTKISGFQFFLAGFSGVLQGSGLRAARQQRPGAQRAQ